MQVKFSRQIWESLLVALALTVISVAWSWAGVEVGRLWVPAGAGVPKSDEVTDDLFRFDSNYYLVIAEQGYLYNGDPASSPNVVFAPLFPMLVKASSSLLGLSPVGVGFALNHLLLFFALFCLFEFLRGGLDPSASAFCLLALVTSAGSYALNAFYSESTMLACLALALLSWVRGWRWCLAFAVMMLGASRLAALPFVIGFAGHLLLEAWEERRHPRRAGLRLLQASLCGVGLACYWIYLAVNFGELYSLLTSIQSTSWGLFHQDTAWWKALFGVYLVDDLAGVVARGLEDSEALIKALNLGWMLLGLVAAGYSAFKWRFSLMTFLFVSYFLFIYWNAIGSDFLISTHRFMLMMLPLYLMFAEWVRRLRESLGSRLAYFVMGVLMLINAAFGLLHTAYFNQGVWYYF